MTPALSICRPGGVAVEGPLGWGRLFLRTIGVPLRSIHIAPWCNVQYRDSSFAWKMDKMALLRSHLGRIPLTMAALRLLEALEDLAAYLRVAARCAPAEFPEWGDAPEVHFAEIARLWTEIRPSLRQDLAEADDVGGRLGAKV